MTLNSMPSSVDHFRLHPVESRHAPMFCLALLTASCAIASFALVCATPFAAFAVVASAMLPVRRALLVVTGAWLVNQTIGYGALHYPVDAKSIAWGFVIGGAALAATLTSAGVLRVLPPNRTPPILVLSLACVYAAYELMLFAATPFLGGEGAFTLAIISRLGLISAAWLIGLVATCEVVRLVNSLHQRRVIS